MQAIIWHINKVMLSVESNPKFDVSLTAQIGFCAIRNVLTTLLVVPLKPHHHQLNTYNIKIRCNNSLFHECWKFHNAPGLSTVSDENLPTSKSELSYLRASKYKCVIPLPYELFKELWQLYKQSALMLKHTAFSPQSEFMFLTWISE
jgi:hypothetical protein